MLPVGIDARKVESMRIHAVLGLLITGGGEIRRYDANSGNFLHVLSRFGSDVELVDFLAL